MVAPGDALLSPARHQAPDRRVRRRGSQGRAAGPRAGRAHRPGAGDVGCSWRGLSNDEIAAQLYVSPPTVKTHANRAMAKLGARDRAQLVVFAYQAGLVRPGWA